MTQDRSLVHPVATREKVRTLIKQGWQVHLIMREVPTVSRAYVYRQRRIVHPPVRPELALESPVLTKAKVGLERAYKRFLKDQTPSALESLNVAQRRYESARKVGR